MELTKEQLEQIRTGKRVFSWEGMQDVFDTIAARDAEIADLKAERDGFQSDYDRLFIKYNAAKIEQAALHEQMEALRKAAQDLLNERAATAMNEYEAYQFVFKSQGREFWTAVEGALAALDTSSEGKDESHAD